MECLRAPLQVPRDRCEDGRRASRVRGKLNHLASPGHGDSRSSQSNLLGFPRFAPYPLGFSADPLQDRADRLPKGTNECASVRGCRNQNWEERALADANGQLSLSFRRDQLGVPVTETVAGTHLFTIDLGFGARADLGYIESSPSPHANTSDETKSN